MIQPRTLEGPARRAWPPLALCLVIVISWAIVTALDSVVYTQTTVLMFLLLIVTLSLQMFSGPFWKDAVLHRVQRVDKSDETIGPAIDGFRTRRVNLTLRYVPDEHVTAFRDLAPSAREHVRGYVQELGRSSDFWAVSGANA